MQTRAVSLMGTWDGKSEPPIDCVKVVGEMDLAVQLWQRYVSTALMPLAGSSLAVRREMTAFNGQTLSRIEGKINDLMQRTTDCKRVFICVRKGLLTIGI